MAVESFVNLCRLCMGSKVAELPIFQLTESTECRNTFDKITECLPVTVSSSPYRSRVFDSTWKHRYVVLCQGLRFYSNPANVIYFPQSYSRFPKMTNYQKRYAAIVTEVWTSYSTFGSCHTIPRYDYALYCRILGKPLGQKSL